jgi:hypothetical protein
MCNLAAERSGPKPELEIPKSQSKMYPVAPACLIRFVKRISISFLNVIGLNVRVRTTGPVIAKLDDQGNG